MKAGVTHKLKHVITTCLGLPEFMGLKRNNLLGFSIYSRSYLSQAFDKNLTTTEAAENTERETIQPTAAYVIKLASSLCCGLGGSF